MRFNIISTDEHKIEYDFLVKKYTTYLNALPISGYRYSYKSIIRDPDSGVNSINITLTMVENYLHIEFIREGREVFPRLTFHIYYVTDESLNTELAVYSAVNRKLLNNKKIELIKRYIKIYKKLYYINSIIKDYGVDKKELIALKLNFLTEQLIKRRPFYVKNRIITFYDEYNGNLYEFWTNYEYFSCELIINTLDIAKTEESIKAFSAGKIGPRQSIIDKLEFLEDTSELYKFSLNDFPIKKISIVDCFRILNNRYEGILDYLSS